MENRVKFPSFIPNEVVELYRKLDLQRRELERQRTYVQDNLLGKQGRKVSMKDSHEADDGKKVRLASSLMVNANQHTDVLIEELERDSEQHTEVLPEKAGKKTSEDFLSPEEDLEMQMTESTNETIGSCDFEADNLIVSIGDVEDRPSFGIVLEGGEQLQKEDETVMSHMQRLVTMGDKKKLACLLAKRRLVDKILELLQ